MPPSLRHRIVTNVVLIESVRARGLTAMMNGRMSHSRRFLPTVRAILLALLWATPAASQTAQPTLTPGMSDTIAAMAHYRRALDEYN
jgi:hypothetical protein